MRNFIKRYLDPADRLGEILFGLMLSNLIGLVLLFMLGVWWGRVVGANPWRIGAGLTVVGGVLVGTTIALGG